MAWSANYTPTAQRRSLGEVGVSGINRDARVAYQPGQHRGAKSHVLIRLKHDKSVPEDACRRFG
jgi:hypothetical protein